MSHEEDRGDEPRLVSIRTMDIVMALLLLAVAGVVIGDSLRLGVRWRDTEGPGAGYFPFYIGLLLAICSAVTLMRAAFARHAPARTFVSRPAFHKVLAVLIPLIVYVAAIGAIGIYVASAIYITLFMWYFGRYSPIKGVAIAAAISAVLFLMFEIWFLVPLPKGPVEALFGY